MDKFGLSRYMIYKTIQNDPSFPVINIGPKKNYRVYLNLFEEWFNRRANTTVSGDEVPTANELIKEFTIDK